MADTFQLEIVTPEKKVVDSPAEEAQIPGKNAYLGIQSSDPVTHANALEFLDNTLTAQLRARLVPLIDSEVSFEERVQLADRFLGLTARA